MTGAIYGLHAATTAQPARPRTTAPPPTADILAFLVD